MSNKTSMVVILLPLSTFPSPLSEEYLTNGNIIDDVPATLRLQACHHCPTNVE